MMSNNGVFIHSKASKKSLALTKHPTYFEMVSDAVVTLKEDTGLSQYAIRKFIQDKYKDHLPAKFKKRLSNRLNKFVASKKLVKVKAFYTLPSTAKPAAKTKPDAKVKLAPKSFEEAADIFGVILAHEAKQHTWTFPWAPFWSSTIGWS